MNRRQKIVFMLRVCIEYWPESCFILACFGAVLGAVLHYGFGVPQNSPWLLISVICVMPGLLALSIACFILPIFAVVLGPLTMVFSTLVVGRRDSTLLTVVDVVWVFVKKIVPRLFVIAAVFVASYLLRGRPVFFLIPLGISLLLVHSFPPRIETLYILKKTGDPKQDRSNFINLLKASKDKDSGEYRVGQSIAVKSYATSFLLRYWHQFRSQQNCDEYEVFLHSKSKKDYNSHYLMLVEMGYGDEA